MNSSIMEIPKKKLEKKKNIREIYLQALNHNKGFKKSNKKKKGISNLTNEERNSNFSGSNFLEKEYNLVQRIISDTKELKNIKVKQEILNKNDPNIQAMRQIAPKYKSQEEYYQEVIELKKMINLMKNNEIIVKAKFEYYENEIAKKEREILELLDFKKADVVSLAESKSESISLVYNLKQRAYKLEFAMKRKDYELNKLKNDLKTTNMKELQMQNERLRIELSNALTSDKKIIEAFEKQGVSDQNGLSYYDSDLHRSVSEISLNKREILKQNIAKQLQGDIYEDSSEFISKFKNIDKKIVLKGTLREKLEQLDQRETELLKEIESLSEEIDQLKKENNKSMTSIRPKDYQSDSDSSTRESKIFHNNEKLNENELNNIKNLQSIMRGHLQRVNSLNKGDERRSPSPVIQTRKPPKDLSPPNSPFHSEQYIDNEIYQHERNHRHNHDDDNRHGRRIGRKQRPSSRVINSDESDGYEKRIPIEDVKIKKTEGVDTACCSSWRKKDKKES